LDLIRVYRVPFSTNVERVALAAGHKGIAIEWVDVDPDDRSVVEALSGQPLVPVLETGDVVLSDSPRILEWLEEHYPKPPLLPRDAAPRAEVRIFCEWFNRVWKVAPNAIADAGATEALVAEMRASVALFEGLLDHRDYFFGGFSLADVTAFPFLKYPVLGLADDDRDSFHRGLVDYLPVGPGSPLRDWVARVDAHPRS